MMARKAAALDQLGDEIVTDHFLPFDRRRGWDQLVERGFGGHGLSGGRRIGRRRRPVPRRALHREAGRSEEHTSELQSLMRISYAVFCLKKKRKSNTMSHT